MLIYVRHTERESILAPSVGNEIPRSLSTHLQINQRMTSAVKNHKYLKPRI
jgi:hypothetical protein